MSWDAVGAWVLSVADSGLVVGVIGAGAALGGGWVSNKRGKRERAEDQAREDIAAFRDARMTTYGQVVALAEALATEHFGLARVFSKGEAVPTLYGRKKWWDTMESAAHDDYGKLRSIVIESRFRERKAVRSAMFAVLNTSTELERLLMSSYSGGRLDSKTYFKAFNELQSDITKMVKVMRRELGLPEDE